MLKEWLDELTNGTFGAAFARTDATSIVDDNGDEALLAEEYGKLIEGYQKLSGVSRVKAQGLGDPSAGSMVYSRFQNAVVAAYGTARTATEGDAVIDDQVTVNLNDYREIIEEIDNRDLKQHGIKNIVQRRVPNHVQRMVAYLDRAALAAAKTAAAAASQNTDITWPNGTAPDYLDLIEQAILKVETTTNDYVDGVSRDNIVVFLKPSIYSKVQQKLDTVYAYDGSTGIVQVPGYHGVQVISEHYLPSGTDFIVTTVGNIAQPVYSEGYVQGDRIPLSNAIELSLFFNTGVKILAPDLVHEGEFKEASPQ